MNNEAKNIASFKRGLGPKLLKTMGRTKCATFNEFVSDALTQENYNTVYTATKTRKRAFEAGAGSSQSKAPVAAKPPFRAPMPNQRYRPPVVTSPVLRLLKFGSCHHPHCTAYLLSTL